MPYPRVEYTAGRIAAYFNLDLSLISGYGLPKAARDLLIALSLLKVRRFIASGLRLRTACDFTPAREIEVKSPAGFPLPDEGDLLNSVQAGIKTCAEAALFSSPPVTLIDTPVVQKADKKEEAGVTA